MDSKEHPEAELNRRKEMVRLADRGLGGQGTLVAVMFELKDAIDLSREEATTLAKTIKALNWWLLVFTIAIFALTGVLAYIAVKTFIQ
jgi:hypothetical protein